MGKQAYLRFLGGYAEVIENSGVDLLRGRDYRENVKGDIIQIGCRLTYEDACPVQHPRVAVLWAKTRVVLKT